MTPYRATVGSVSVSLFERAGEVRLDLRTAWGTGINMDAARLSELIEALRGAERMAKHAAG